MFNKLLITKVFQSLFFLFLLAGCKQTEIPNFQKVKNELDIPLDWKNEPKASRYSDSKEKWWFSFKDPQINKMIDLALNKNNGISAAVFRLKEARLNEELIGTNISPEFTSGANGSVSKLLNNDQPSSRTYGVTNSISYEVDLWGKLSQSRDIAHWEKSATDSDLLAAKLKVIGSALEIYWRHSYLTEKIELHRESIAYLEYLKKLSTLRLSVGDGNKLDLLQAQQNLANYNNQLKYLLYQLEQNHNDMAILLNQAPSTPIPFLFKKNLNDLFEPLDAPLPIVLLSRRPDLQAAEKRLMSKFTNIDVTAKNFYPELSLNSSLSTGGNRNLLKIFQDPIGTLGATLALPFIQYNKMKLSIKISETQYLQSVANFRQIFYNALKEVQEILDKRALYNTEKISLRIAEVESRQALDITELGWKVGSVSLKDVLEQKQQLLYIRRQMIENKFNRYLSERDLYLAIGGGINL